MGGGDGVQVDSVAFSGLLIRCYACTIYLVTQSWLPPWSGPTWCLVFAVRSGLRPNMVPPIGPELRGRILQPNALKHNIFSILYHLSLENVIVCERTVCRVLKTAKEAGTKPQQNARAAKKRNASSVRSPEVIKKLKRWTAQEDPPKQRYMARLAGISQPTLSRIVNEDLARVCLKKPTAPKLTDAQVAQRKVRTKPFSLLVS